ncbi:hypothetical protein DBV05_g10549 [Lasiodiplodia theobromae]|uniref:Uncharacterized protein n=2 Tax=Lasiodiplodia theobromae TaxID=45133 RepID=A0A5N5CZG9_9PEZI|nr:hypothetical protein DBV05_g10549 [Lasiodiplodia theobromae]
MLRENFLYFYKPERRLKLTYYSKERTLYYTMPTIIPEKLATRIGYAIEDRIEDIIKEYSMHYDDDQVVDRDLRCWFTGGPWQISTREKWNEVRLDRVGYLGGSNVRYRQPFGLEFSFAQDFHILTDKVTKAMMQPRGPDMVILIRIGYDSAEAFEEAAVDPTAVAALDKTADYTIYQVFTEMTDDGQHRAQVHPSVYRRAFRASDGSAVEGDLEFTFGDFIGLKPEKVFLDPLIREKLLQQKITIPFSKLTKWLDRGESWETSDQLQMRQFGPFPPPEPVNVFPIADRDDSD